MSLFDEALAKAAEESIPSLDVDVELGGKHVPLHIYRIAGEKWAEITALCPARLGSAIDRRYGYNFQAAARIAAPLSIRVVDDGEEIEYDDAKWTAFFAALPGHGIKLIHSAIWQLNEYDPEVRVAEAKKGLTGGSEQKPN
jgi:hypothetical protein